MVVVVVMVMVVLVVVVIVTVLMVFVFMVVVVVIVVIVVVMYSDICGGSVNRYKKYNLCVEDLFSQQTGHDTVSSPSGCSCC